jgi:hypothetical protein
VYHWPELKITHRFVDLAIPVPQEIKLNRIQSSTIKEILAGKYFVLIFTKTVKNKFQILPLENSEWADIHRSPENNVMVIRPRDMKEAPPIYPSLQTM